MRFFTHRNYVKKVRRNDIDFCSSKLRRTKYVKTRSIFRSSRLRQTKHVEMTLIFSPSKLRPKKYIKTTSIFCHRNYVEQRTSKRHRIFAYWQFFTHRNYVEQRTSRRLRIFARRNYIEKVRWNDVGICWFFLLDVST